MNNIMLKNGKIINDFNFFMISNLGGGGSDKYRESVYQNIYNNIPNLYNYYYITEGGFAKQELSNLHNYSSFKDFINYVQYSFYKKGYRYNEYSSLYSSNPLLMLDSGASNIIKKLIKDGKISNESSLKEIEYSIWNKAVQYYDFSNRYKFDIVIGFDIGGKYTFKAGEKSDKNYNSIMNFIDDNSFEINKFLRDKTAKYLNDNIDFYPSVYFTIHGYNQDQLELELNDLLMLNKNTYNFFGIALGGMASYKNVDSSWFSSVNLKANNKTPYLMSKSLNIIRQFFHDKPIHVLGGGGIRNIPIFAKLGINSFDCQTPARRAYDGNNKSVYEVNDPSSNEHFSKYLIGKIKYNYDIINTNSVYEYKKINLLDNSVNLCGCPACSRINNIGDLKKFYSLKNYDKEAYYFSRQLMNIHAIYQHIYLKNYCCKHNLSLYELKQFFDEEYASIYLNLKGDKNE